MPLSWSERMRFTSRSASARAACASRCMARTFATWRPRFSGSTASSTVPASTLSPSSTESSVTTPSTSEAICARSFACSSPLPSMRSWIVSTLTGSTATGRVSSSACFCSFEQPNATSRAVSAASACFDRLISVFLPPPDGLLRHEPTQQRIDGVLDAGLRPILFRALDPPRGEPVEQAEERLAGGGGVSTLETPLLPQLGPGLFEQLLHLKRGARRCVLLGARGEQ